MNEELNKNWQFRQAGKDKWFKALVPGCVHTDLQGNKLIEDPYYRTNEKDLQWIDKEEWEYRTTFVADNQLLEKERVELVFNGLDTFAEVFINDSPLLTADNMFRIWRADCKKLLKKGDNTLLVKFHSPVNAGVEKLEKNTFKGKRYTLPAGNDNSQLGGLGDKKVSVFTRKAPYHYGWDWGPRFVTSGIWRPVKWVAWDKIKIRDLFVTNDKITKNAANLTAVLEIEATAGGIAEISIDVDEDTAIKKEISLTPGLNTVKIGFEIDEPLLWWPNGMGSRHVYKITAAVETEDRKDDLTVKHGIRTVRLVREPDKDGKGKSFYFEINGVPVFAKGANMIPADVFLDRVIPSKYAGLVMAAQMANMNMIRVWGGGIYEDDFFYDLCDQAGIMVWQDFMFACSLYPGDDAFIENVRREAVDNVKRLRKHPSIVLWCGNNENHVAWNNWGYKKDYEKQDPELAKKIKGDYDRVFHDVLPEVVSKYHKQVPYWPSSPMADWDPAKGIEEVAKPVKTTGDEHYWGVWHAEEPFENYKKNIPRFMSEYGFQSFPEFRTVKSYTLPEDRHIDSEVMQAHQRHPRGNKLIRQYMAAHYHIPAEFRHFLYVSQLLQAEGMKTAITAHRRNMPYCMGSLYWQLNDCWPVASWAGLDYYLRWKALHYYARKAFAPVLVSIVENGEHIDFHVVSDHPKPFKGDLLMMLMDFEGKILWTAKKTVTTEFNKSLQAYRVSKKELLEKGDTKQTLLLAQMCQIHDTGLHIESRDIHYFLPVKDLDLPNTQVKATIEQIEDLKLFFIRLKSDTLAKNVYLEMGDVVGFFTDNFFDILPGDEVTIRYQCDKPVEELRRKLRITTLRDTY